ncbi:uL30 family ribosomal protein [Candidatus Woesearchaeota archaeon]|nr:uL30 family ribosomal protein [Candidatus Woesearchaeota archaeon]
MNANAEKGKEKRTEPKLPKTEKKAVAADAKGKGKIAVVLIRSPIGVRHDMKMTLRLLNLFNQHNCIVVDDTPINMGMVKKLKDFVTFGPVSEETIKMLEKKNKIGEKTYKLDPPKGGFERKGIKMPYGKGGALGQRDNMDNLIKKMI